MVGEWVSVGRRVKVRVRLVFIPSYNGRQGFAATQTIFGFTRTHRIQFGIVITTTTLVIHLVAVFTRLKCIEGATLRGMLAPGTGLFVVLWMGDPDFVRGTVG